jgi:hypothetical protein
MIHALFQLVVSTTYFTVDVNSKIQPGFEKEDRIQGIFIFGDLTHGARRTRPLPKYSGIRYVWGTGLLGWPCMLATWLS